MPLRPMMHQLACAALRYLRIERALGGKHTLPYVVGVIELLLIDGQVALQQRVCRNNDGSGAVLLIKRR